MKRCIYCDFVSGIFDPEKAESYIDALQIELQSFSADLPLSTLFIGGGTPTALPAETLSRLLETILNHFTFKDNYETTIEANPGTVDRQKTKVLLESGINRLSIGVQSFNDEELTFLGRIHSSEDAVNAVQLARAAGVHNIGIDLIYGIPGQTLASWKHSLERAVDLNPKHLSTYELTVAEGTPLSRLNLHRSEEEIIEMYEYTIDFLTGQGFIHYEISNFARPGYECRHNINYWDRGAYYGAGLGAHSFTAGRRRENTDNLDRYLSSIMQHGRPSSVTESVDEETGFSEAIFLGLRKTEGIIVESLALEHHRNILSLYHDEIEALQTAGLITVSPAGCSYETNIRLTRKGLLLSNEVFEKFIQFS